MNHCPNCGTNISAEQTVCSCGELLRAEATQHLQSWETETVFRPKAAVNVNRIAPLAVSAVILSVMFVWSWPHLLSNWKTSVDPDKANVSQTSSQPDVVQSSDLIDGDPATVNQEGVFDFTKGERPQNSKLKAAVRQTGDVKAHSGDTTVSGNSYDAQLLSDKTNDMAKPPEGKALPDCKPDATATLKRSEPPTVNDIKLQPKQSATNYILGPRGGCFFVTVSGSKRYVDHSLCTGSTAAAARQD